MRSLVSRSVFISLATLVIGSPPWYQAQLPIHKEDAVPVNAKFMSAEHALLGNYAKLRFPDGELLGANQNYIIGDHNVSYGMVVALAGDYFGDIDLENLDKCPESISDGWDQDPEASINRFKRVAGDMMKATRETSECILDYLGRLNGEICWAVKSGEDPVQAYKKYSSAYDVFLSLCKPTFKYALLARCNWDHFGEDAIKAYQAGHTTALRQAVEASKQNDRHGLELAYFFEAYSQHFLTDLFSAGHLRAPRRQLHSQFLDLSPNLSPGDRNCQEQHDEDCANGLWVTNKLGESWVAYGDKELMSSKSFKNMDQAIAAVQLGADEVWQAYDSGKIKSTGDYQALQKIPNLKNTQNVDSFTPLFTYDPVRANILKMRANVTDRSTTDVEDHIIDPQDNTAWAKLLAKIQSSGPATNHHAATVDGLLPQTMVTQLRQVNDTSLVVNKYGLITTKNYKSVYINLCSAEPDQREDRASWNMLSQDIVKIPNFETPVVWRSVIPLGNGILGLMGTRMRTGLSPTAVYLALKDGAVVWKFEEAILNPEASLGDALFEYLSGGSNRLAIVEHQKVKDRSYFSLRIFEHGASREPKAAVSSLQWSSPLAMQSFVYNSTALNAPAFVSVAHNSTTQTFTWTIASWTSDYENQKIQTVIEENRPWKPHTVIQHEDKILRVFDTHGPNGKNFKIDVLTFDFASETPKIKILSSAEYIIQWDRKSEYRSIMFTQNSDNPSSSELPSLTLLMSEPKTHILFTVVFPAISGYRYGYPVTKLITPPGKVETFTAPFLNSIRAEPVAYTYKSGKTTKAAVLQLFDNFGVLGARLLAPMLGENNEKYQYEAVGQVPAIAGQSSKAIGFVFGDF